MSAFVPLTSLADAAAQLARGATSAVQFTETALARASEGEGPKTCTRVLHDSARAEAHASDTLRAAGLARSPIEGLPISVKDLFDIAGHVTRAGSRLLRSEPPATRNAPIVDRLRAAGAVIVGTTNMTEFAFSGIGINPHYGTPRNPWAREGDGRIPGGSSSGAAISVTDGMALAAIGTDTGGSVRIPAALCGLTGFKPTARRVPSAGTIPLSTTLDSIGPLAPSVRCCALLDSLLAGEPFAEPMPAAIASMRLLAPTNYVLAGMDHQVGTAWERALSRLSQAGARITHAALAPLDALAGIHAQGTLANAEAWAWHRRYLPARQGEYDPRVAARILVGSRMNAADYIDLLAARQRWIAAMQAALADYDALVMPTVPVVAPEIAPLVASDEAFAAANALILRNTTLVNFLDGCAVSLPMHQKGEPPCGLSLAAPGGHDARLLALALAVEKELSRAAP
ncbi:MAG: amidase [Comamonas sp. SCN 65-56]|uniref:amidase n=1 Tax=Comamonas sp. SCN 65-56 TaxID=1660095 RepID=UPI00086868E7|nr:amidase [Comamonas sp. SCN 65-56]ODS93249.1 MAG: amidase [Comamonas sp. SCN 65-56]